MLLGDIKTQRKNRARGKRVILRLLEEEGFRTTKKIKFGSRYYIAEGRKEKQRALFKSCIYSRSYDHLTNQKFSREILFLDFITHSKYRQLKQATPRILSSGLDTRAWYIREYIAGKPQNINGGNIRFKKGFFSPKTLDWITRTLFELHSITKEDLPPNFQKLLYAPQTLGYLWQFIGPYSKHIESYIGLPGSGKQIERIFKSYNTIYRNAPRVLAHQEPYAPHILDVHGQYKLIDWENVGWASILKDAVTVWMRASKLPSWQHKLHRRFRLHYRTYRQFDKLWTTTVFVQSVFNIIGYYYYPDKSDFEELARYSGAIIKKTLKQH